MENTRILIVDDHPMVRHGLAQLIGNEPDLYICGEAATRDQALELARSGRPDMVLLDVALGDTSGTGLDLIRDLHSICGKVPVLVVSMYDETLYAERALRMGARGYLMKQEPVRQVVAAIRRILEGGVYLSDEMNQFLLLRHVGPPSRGQDNSPAEVLSDREFEVFRLVGKGMPPREIAETMNLSPKTIETHRQNIKKKLGIESAAELMRFAVEWVHRSGR